MRSAVFPVCLLALSLVGCPRRSPPEPEKSTSASSGGIAQAAPGASLHSPAGMSAVPPQRGPDPLGGRFSLEEATTGIPGGGKLLAKIDTDKGLITCELFEDKAPNSVANFVGLATGNRPWKDPKTRTWVRRPAYDGTTFHRVIKGFMIQGGDPLGNGSGEPGYVIDDEIWPGARHDKPGLLCMANRGPNTNGAQFFITDGAAAHLDGGYTIFGQCSPVSVVHEIAALPTVGDRPASPPAIKSVKIQREDPTAKPPASSEPTSPSREAGTSI